MTEVLTPVARGIRVVGTLVLAGVLLTGTLWGQDDDFPFGPFSMFAGVNPPDAPAPDTRVEIVDVTGGVIVLTERNSGIRRAEIEGREGEFDADPARLGRIVALYTERNPGAARPVEVRIVVRWHEIRASRPTGRWRDATVAVWRP